MSSLQKKAHGKNTGKLVSLLFKISRQQKLLEPMLKENDRVGEDIFMDCNIFFTLYPEFIKKHNLASHEEDSPTDKWIKHKKT